MLDVNKFYIRKGVKIKNGYYNDALYDMINHKVFLLNKNDCEYIMSNKWENIDGALINKLQKEKLLTLNIENEEKNVCKFEYDLFGDKYLFKQCTQIFLEITNYCNFKCLHCYADFNNKNNKFLTCREVEEIIKKLNLKSVDIRVTGGEPFLNKEIRSILKSITESIQPLTRHSIVTNGSFDVNDALYALELGYEMQISLYGLNEELFNLFTQTNKNYFKKIMQNLYILSKTKFKNNIVIQISSNKLTYKKIDEFVQFSKSLGFKYNINRPASVGRAVKNWEKLELSKTEKIQLAQRTKSKNLDFCYHLCQLHWTAIDVNGNVTPCTFFRADNKKNIIGNIFNDSFLDIWWSKKYDNFRNCNPNLVDKCKNCEFEYVCTAGCVGETVAYTKNFYNCYPWCIEKPYQSHYLKIKKGEIYQVDKLAAGIFNFQLIN